MATPTEEDQAVLGQLLRTLPACVLPCTARYPPDCPPTTKSCLCRPIHGATLDCVFQSCKGWDIILAKRATSVACGDPFPEDGRNLRRLSWACIGVATVAVFLRVAGRVVASASARRGTGGRTAVTSTTTRGLAGLWWDDALLLATYALMVAVMALSEVGLSHGFGDGPWVSGPQDLNLQGLLVFIGEPLYFLAAAALKASFLLFFARIFAVGSSLHQRWGLPVGGLRDRWALTGVLRWAHCANVVVTGAFMAVIFFQCQPMSYFWKGWDGVHQGTCINRKAVPLVHAVLGIVLDVWILVIPLCMLPSLRVSFWKKMGIASMLCVGTLATMVSCLRIPIVSKDIKSGYSLTWNQTEVLGWTMIEMTAGIVCACMPGHGALFSRLFRRARTLLGIATSTGSPSGHSRSNSNGSGGGGGGGGGGARTPSIYLPGTPSSVVTAVPRDGDILAKTHVEVRQTAIGERVGPWGSTVELTGLGEKAGDGDDGFRGDQVVETKIWAGSIGRSKSLGRSITLGRTRSKIEKSRRRASQPGRR